MAPAQGLLASLPDLRIDRRAGRRSSSTEATASGRAPRTRRRPTCPTTDRSTSSAACTACLAPIWRSAPASVTTVRVTPSPTHVVVDHVLANEAPAPVEVAPWAITMCTPGGEAWVPRYMGPSDAHGLQANGSLVLWPYTRLPTTGSSWTTRSSGCGRSRVPRCPARSACPAGRAGSPIGWGAPCSSSGRRYIEGATYADLGASIPVLQRWRLPGDRDPGSAGHVGARDASIDHRETWSLHAVDHRHGMDELLGDLGLA